MPIKVQCRCGRVLLVKEEMAGKTGRCPECEQLVKIPSAEDDGEETLRKHSQAIRSRTDEDDWPSSRRRVDEAEDEEEDARPRRRRKRGDRKEPARGRTIALLSIGIAALILLALAPF